jgi:hypothetical protein
MELAMANLKRREMIVACACAACVTGGIVLQTGEVRTQEQESLVYGKEDPQDPGIIYVDAEITQATGGKIYARRLDTNTPITIVPLDKIITWKGTESRGLNRLVSGDRIFVQLQKAPDGKYYAARIWANLVSIYGRIVNFNGGGFTMLVLKPGIPRYPAKVVVGSHTAYGIDGEIDGRTGSGTVDDIQDGRFVQVIGHTLPDGRIAATRIYVSTEVPGVSIPGP